MNRIRVGLFSLALLGVSALAGGMLGGRVLAGNSRLSDHLRLYTAILSAVEEQLRGRREERPARLLLDPRDAAHPRSAFELPGDEGVRPAPGAPEGLVLRPRHHRAVGGREHHRRLALRGDARAPPGHPRRRRHQQDRGRGRAGHGHRRRGQAPARPEGDRPCASRWSGRATTPRSSSRSSATRSPSTPSPTSSWPTSGPGTSGSPTSTRRRPVGPARGRTASASWRRRSRASPSRGLPRSCSTSATTRAAFSTRPSRSRTSS